VTAESNQLKFKWGYEWKGTRREEEADEVARDVAQFANTEGGTLLIGIGEKDLPDGRRVATDCPGVPDACPMHQAWLAGSSKQSRPVTETIGVGNDWGRAATSGRAVASRLELAAREGPRSEPTIGLRWQRA
jgi:hypothetical protein